MQTVLLEACAGQKSPSGIPGPAKQIVDGQADGNDISSAGLAGNAAGALLINLVNNAIQIPCLSTRFNPSRTEIPYSVGSGTDHVKGHTQLPSQFPAPQCRH
jgi:hypothetical protein